jgi:hypothetical protein
LSFFAAFLQGAQVISSMRAPIETSPQGVSIRESSIEAQMFQNLRARIDGRQTVG